MPSLMNMSVNLQVNIARGNDKVPDQFIMEFFRLVTSTPRTLFMLLPINPQKILRIFLAA